MQACSSIFSSLLTFSLTPFGLLSLNYVFFSSMEEPSQPHSLIALVVFKHTIDEELIKSLHVYRVGDGNEEEKVEREFLFSNGSSSYVEIEVNPLFRLKKFQASELFEGRVIGLWLCIFVFDINCPVFVDIPSILLISRNPKLNGVPTLARDLQKIFQLSCNGENEEPAHFSAEEMSESERSNSSNQMIFQLSCNGENEEPAHFPAEEKEMSESERSNSSNQMIFQLSCNGENEDFPAEEKEMSESERSNNSNQMNLHLSCNGENEEPAHFPAKEKKVSESERSNNSNHQLKRNLPVFDQDLNLLPYSTGTSDSESSEIQQSIDNPTDIAAKKKKKKQKRAATKDIARIALEDLAKYFDVPIVEASKNLKVGLTVLKRKCREFGIPRWPHRKIKSLDSLIRDLQEEAERQWQDKAAAMAVAKRQRMLEGEKESIENKPFMEIQSETKRFRQDVFKRRHRARARKDRCRSLSPTN